MKNQQIQEPLFNTSINQGLSDAEVASRRARFGWHLLKPVADTWVSLLFRQLKSPFIYLLLAAASFSLILNDVSNSLVIFTIITINTLLSFIQEYRASRAARLLASYIIPTARVRRNGKESIIQTKELVPGDVVILSPGDAIPADMRLVQSDNLTIDESALTGESTPVEKSASAQKDTMVFMGTSVLTGAGTALVTATGADTKFGEITTLTLLTPHESSFQQNLTELSAFLIKMTLVLLLCVLIINLIIKGGNVNIMQLLLFCVALAVTVTPEALPVVTTFALSEGAFALARQKVIVKRLSAIEDLGSITMLCTDKTGTLTENKLTVVDVLPYQKGDPLLLASVAQPPSLSTFEIATVDKLSDEQKKELSSYQVIAETPFDPVHRRTSKLIKSPEGTILVVKGAFEEISSRCTNVNAQDLQKLNDWTHEQGLKGERVIGIAVKLQADENLPLSQQEKDLMLYGLIAFADPIKKTVPDALHRAQSLGIKIKILTGDSPDVAGAVASSIGLISSPKNVITGAQLDKLSEVDQRVAIDKYLVFARVTPQQKYTIIEHLKQHETVGYLGDGINDAPALKAAHVGIVVVEASDIARSAADIILLKKSLSVIIEGIARGRTVFVNTVKYVKTTLSASMGNFYSVAIASFFIEQLPMLPLQLLVVNLIADSPMIAIATDNVDPEDLQRPTSYPVREFGFAAVIFGLISSVFDFIVFGLYSKGPIAILQTTWFMTSILTELAFIFSMRSRKFILLAVRPSWPLVILAVAAALAGVILPFSSFGQNTLSLLRPSFGNMVTVFFIVTGYLTVNEIVKIFYYRMQSRLNNKSKRKSDRAKL